MNIIFRDKLASDTFHNTVQRAGNERLKDLLCHFLTSSWTYDDFTDIQVSPGSAKYPRPAYSNITGLQTEVEISVCSNDCQLLPDQIGSGFYGQKSIYPGCWISKEFDFIIYAYPVDEYGQIIRDPSKRRKVMNGGIINHGSVDNPSWSSHS